MRAFYAIDPLVLPLCDSKSGAGQLSWQLRLHPSKSELDLTPAFEHRSSW